MERSSGCPPQTVFGFGPCNWPIAGRAYQVNGVKQPGQRKGVLDDRAIL